MNSISKRFIGTWKLVSYELHSGSEVIYPFGKNPVGYIMYNNEGYMSIAFTPSNRSRFASTDMTEVTTEEKVNAADTYFSYCGRYEVIEDKVIHLIEICFYPNWIGEKQERVYKFEGDKLILSTPPVLFNGKEQSSLLIWKRV